MAEKANAAGPGTKQSNDDGVADWKRFEQRVANFLASQ